MLGVSTRRMDKLVATLGIDSLSKSRVSRMSADLDAQVTAFRTRRLDDASLVYGFEVIGDPAVQCAHACDERRGADR